MRNFLDILILALLPVCSQNIRTKYTLTAEISIIMTFSLIPALISLISLFSLFATARYKNQSAWFR